jgi:hypothetical protein
MQRILEVDETICVNLNYSDDAFDIVVLWQVPHSQIALQEFTRETFTSTHISGGRKYANPLEFLSYKIFSYEDKIADTFQNFASGDASLNGSDHTVRFMVLLLHISRCNSNGTSENKTQEPTCFEKSCYSIKFLNAQKQTARNETFSTRRAIRSSD